MVTKPDKEGNPVGTGVAYVRFASPTEADRARKERHRQQMGARYIECLPFTASHYTSPASLPAQMGALAPMGSPYPMAMGARYPGPPPAQRQFPSMSALGQALPTQEVRSPACQSASVATCIWDCDFAMTVMSPGPSGMTAARKSHSA